MDEALGHCWNVRNIKEDLKLTGGSNKDGRRKGENMNSGTKRQHFDLSKQAISCRSREGERAGHDTDDAWRLGGGGRQRQKKRRYDLSGTDKSSYKGKKVLLEKKP